MVAISVFLLNKLETTNILGKELNKVYQSALRNNIDIVPDEETAIAIAKSVLEPKYGEVERELKAQFYDKLGLWVVWGDIAEPAITQISPYRTNYSVTLRGEPYLFIRKKDGKMSIIYYK